METAVVRIESPGRQPLTLIVNGALELGREGDGLRIVDDRVSRRHARIEPVSNGIRIVDLESANGVIFDGRRIDESTILTPGDTALLGDTRLAVISVDGGTGGSMSTQIVSSNAEPTAIELVAEAVTNAIDAEVIGVADEAGTLTIVFTDIEASTERSLQVGDVRWMDILSHHAALVTAHVEAHRGRIVKNQGDGYMLCFRSARQALLASIGLQRDLEKLQNAASEMALRIRVGMHTGEVLQDDDGDLFGRHVIVAARIGALADGGQILVSSLVRQIAEPRGDLRFGAATEVLLKGVDAPQIVHELDWARSPIDGDVVNH